jgi:hypothetical protein
LFFETGSPHVTQANLELMIPLPPSPKGWDYRSLQPCLAKFTFFKVNTKLKKSRERILMWDKFPNQMFCFC